jgi:hypothetical protein
MKGINQARPWLAIAALAAATVTGRAVENAGTPASARDTSHTSPGFYHALTLAAAPSEATGGGGGQAKEAEDEGGLSEAALAKIAQNPLANLINVPFQNNFNFGIGPNKVTQWVLNIQPVIPFSLSKDWNLITRTIIPIIDLPSTAPGVPSASGLGDINPTFFFSPANSGKLTWGIGPSLTFPTATDSLLGSGMYSAGPAAVVFLGLGQWKLGVIGNNQWSYAGWGPESVNQLTLQPIINYNFGEGWYLVTSPIMTANWKASSSDRWTVPLGGGFGKLQKFGKLPVNINLQAFYNVEKPENGADWQLRFQVQFLFPK